MPPLTVRWAAVIASVAALLAFFAIFRIDLAGSPVISFRYQPRWQSQEILMLGTSGFAISQVTSGPGPRSPVALTSLASVYAVYANGPEVREFILRDGPLHGSYRAFAGTVRSRPLPMLEVEGTARTKGGASMIAARASRGIRGWILQKQLEVGVPAAQRVKLTVASPAVANVKQVQGNRLLWPLIALSVVFALVALALVDARRSKT